MDKTDTIVLLPSPLLGPAVWKPVHALLTARGLNAILAGSPQGQRDCVARARDWLLDAVPEGPDYALVAHSNAGIYVPMLAARRSVTRLLFVDAILPPPAGTLRVAPERLLAMLETLTDEARLLPVWTSWWDEESVAALFPSPEVRSEVEAEQPRLPLAYFREIVAVEPGWATFPAGYLAFGDTYEEETQEAARRGWPIRVLPGRHLHMLTEPDQVAQAMIELLQSPTRRSGREAGGEPRK